MALGDFLFLVKVMVPPSFILSDNAIAHVRQVPYAADRIEQRELLELGIQRHLGMEHTPDCQKSFITELTFVHATTNIRTLAAVAP